MKRPTGRAALQGAVDSVFTPSSGFSPLAVEHFYHFLKEGAFVADNHLVDPDRFYWLDPLYRVTRTELLGVKTDAGLWLQRPKYARGILFRKASQMGASVWSVLFLLWLCTDMSRGLSIGCFWPNQQELQTFVQTRLDKVLKSSPKMLSYMEDSTVDNTVVKTIGVCTVHFRHVSGKSSSDSVPLDVILGDEVRLWETPGDTIQRLEERYGQSEVKLLALFSTVGSSGDFMEQQWGISTQIKYFSTCPQGCHTEIGPDPAQSSQNRVLRAGDLEAADPERMLVEGVVLSDFLPDVVVPDPGPDATYVCPGCGAAIVNPRDGRYVETRPEAEGMYALEFAQTLSPLMEPADLRHKYLTATDMKQFMNGRLAKPWLDPEGRPVKPADWQAARIAGEELQWASASQGGRNVLGADFRTGEMHYVIGELGQGGEPGRLLRLGVYQGGDWEPFLERLLERFQIERAILDYLPFTNEALKVANRHQGRVFLAQYKPGAMIRTAASENSRGNRKVHPDGREKHMVILDQYKSLLASLGSFSSRQWRVPRGPLYARDYVDRKKTVHPVFDVVEGMEGVGREGFRHHLMALAVETKLSTTTNKSREKVHKAGGEQQEMVDASGFDPHWAHAYNYMVMAGQLSGGDLNLLRAKAPPSPAGERRQPGVPQGGRVVGPSGAEGVGSEGWMLPHLKPMSTYAKCGDCLHGPESGEGRCRALGWTVQAEDPECGRRGVFRRRPVSAAPLPGEAEIDPDDL